MFLDYHKNPGTSPTRLLIEKEKGRRNKAEVNLGSHGEEKISYEKTLEKR